MRVCGGALVPLVWKLEKARKQREAVAWVREMGGTVEYAIGNDFFDDVTGVELHGIQVSDVTPSYLTRRRLQNTTASEKKYAPLIHSRTFRYNQPVRFDWA